MCRKFIILKTGQGFKKSLRRMKTVSLMALCVLLAIPQPVWKIKASAEANSTDVLSQAENTLAGILPYQILHILN